MIGAAVAGGIAIKRAKDGKKIIPTGKDIKADPTYYGGSQDALAQARAQSAQGQAAGSQMSGLGALSLYAGTGTAAAQQAQLGRDLVGRGLSAGTPEDLRAVQALEQTRVVDPAALVNAQRQAAQAQAAQQTLAMARLGGAAGIRDAVGANSRAGVDIAGQAQASALAAAAQQQDAINARQGAIATGYNAVAGNNLQQQGLNQNLIGMGAGVLNQGIQTGAGVNETLMNTGMAREQFYAGLGNNVNTTQAQLDSGVELTNTQLADKKKDRNFGMAGNLIGLLGKAGGAAAGMAGGAAAGMAG